MSIGREDGDGAIVTSCHFQIKSIIPLETETYYKISNIYLVQMILLFFLSFSVRLRSVSASLSVFSSDHPRQQHELQVLRPGRRSRKAQAERAGKRARNSNSCNQCYEISLIRFLNHLWNSQTILKLIMNFVNCVSRLQKSNFSMPSAL